MNEIYGLLNFLKWIIIAVVIICLLIVVSAVFSFREPSASKRAAGRTSGRLTRSIKKATTPFYGKKGTGIYKNPGRTVKNKVYRARTKKMF